MWAILSGIEGNLVAYQAVVKDIIKRQVEIEQFFILGDLVGPNPNSELLVEMVRNFDELGEIQPQVCLGWWEEQCFNLYGLGTNVQGDELLNKYGGDTVKLLWKSVSRKTVEWLREQNFGFLELDCLLIHGSSVGVSDELTVDTPAWKMLDRLQRVGANQLFCGRSGQVFEYELAAGSVASTVLTLDEQQPSQTVELKNKKVIGVGAVGRDWGTATYTLYNPYSNQIKFCKVDYD
ncbi:MAG: metallophosphatase [Arthrospira sp. SH-MAG29]|nr:metallophosphatase [Arthrospira sp. SH-MAG29]MBS0018589.1 metallophosphatase [Arthrospira sp. SH-MAG29]